MVNSPYFTPNVNNVFIRTDKPVYVFQKIFGGAMTNTNNLLFIPPLSCVGENIVDLIPDANRIGTTSYSSTELVVLATAANAPTATLGGVVLVPTVNGDTVNGNTDWLTYRYLIGNSNGSIKVSSAGPIQAQLFGASGAVSYTNLDVYTRKSIVG